MILLRLNVNTGTATVTGNATVTVGQPCAVSIAFLTPPDSVAIQLALGKPLLFPDSVLAFLDIDDFNVDDEDDTIYHATLDGTDARLVRHMASLPSDVVQLGLLGEVDGTPIATPYVNVTVQSGIIDGDPNSEGGPTYYTAPQVDAAIAAAVASLGAGINATIVKLTGGDSTALDGQNTSGSGGYELGQFITFNVADAHSSASSPPGVCTYQLITNAAAVAKYGASTDNLPFVVRPDDWSAGAPVWERRS